MDRRELIGGLAALLGVAALPGDVLAAAKVSAKRFLEPAPFALLRAVADTLIPQTDTPGAVAAGVPETFDGLLANWAAPKTRTILTTALSQIDAAAQSSEGKPFVALSPERRKAMLSAYDLAILTANKGKDGPDAIRTFFGSGSDADPGYARLKTLLVTLYYSSEIGLTQELIYEHVPGPFVASMKITPQTRPFTGPTGTF